MIDWNKIMPEGAERQSAEVSESIQAEEPRKDRTHGEIAGKAAGPQHLCAQIKTESGGSFPAHPAAVLLVMAWSRHKQASADERAALLLNLEEIPPADQVKHWHAVCTRDGLKPWHVLYLPAPTWGDDCTKCKYLTTREEAASKDRRRWHWACQHGYLILEHGRGTERVQIAPPECQSFERWYPSGFR